MAVMIALYSPDGSSNGTMPICMASLGSIAIFDMSIKGGVMVLFGVLFVCDSVGIFIMRVLGSSSVDGLVGGL